MYYHWLSEALHTEFEPLTLLKKSERGAVELIRHRTSGQKFILRSFSGSGEVYHKLLDIECPYLPKTYEITSDGNQNLVLEEYIQGDTLDLLLKSGPCSPRETRRIARQLCQALWALHALGAVHRDVKPENIILRGGEAVLIDFDAARLHKPEHDTDTLILGTTGFAAPEQYGLSQTDQRTDIFAVGVLINVMLTGKHPSKKLAEGRMGRIVTRCTQVNPKKRYQSVL